MLQYIFRYKSYGGRKKPNRKGSFKRRMVPLKVQVDADDRFIQRFPFRKKVAKRPFNMVVPKDKTAVWSGPIKDLLR